MTGGTLTLTTAVLQSFNCRDIEILIQKRGLKSHLKLKIWMILV